MLASPIGSPESVLALIGHRILPPYPSFTQASHRPRQFLPRRHQSLNRSHRQQSTERCLYRLAFLRFPGKHHLPFDVHPKRRPPRPGSPPVPLSPCMNSLLRFICSSVICRLPPLVVNSSPRASEARISAPCQPCGASDTSPSASPVTSSSVNSCRAG